MKILTKAFSDSPEIMQPSAKFAGQMNAARGVIFPGAVVSVGGLALPGLPVYGPGEFGAEDSAMHLLPPCRRSRCSPPTTTTQAR